MSTLCGIYIITCLTTGRVYVGSSIDVPARLLNHKTLLIKGKHRNPFLLAAWNKYGAEVFTFKMVAECKPANRHVVEQKWITKLRSTSDERGFNIAHPLKIDAPSPRMSEVSRKSWQDDKTHGNRVAGINVKWKDTDFRQRKLRDGAKARAALAEKRKDPVWRAAFAAKVSATMKARAQTAEGRTHLQFANRVTHERRRDDPEYKAICEAGLGKRKRVSNDIV